MTESKERKGRQQSKINNFARGRKQEEKEQTQPFHTTIKVLSKSPPFFSISTAAKKGENKLSPTSRRKANKIPKDVCDFFGLSRSLLGTTIKLTAADPRRNHVVAFFLVVVKEEDKKA